MNTHISLSVPGGAIVGGVGIGAAALGAGALLLIVCLLMIGWPAIGRRPRSRSRRRAAVEVT